MRAASNNLCIHRTRQTLATTTFVAISSLALDSPIIANKGQEEGVSRAKQSPIERLIATKSVYVSTPAITTPGL